MELEGDHVVMVCGWVGTVVRGQVPHVIHIPFLLF